MTKPKIKEGEEVIKTFTIYCPKCNKAIKGRKRSQVEYLLEIHLKTHEKEE